MPMVIHEKIITRGPRTNPKDEFSPIKVFLKNLGRFWVFSSFIQKQTSSIYNGKYSSANSFSLKEIFSPLKRRFLNIIFKFQFEGT